MASIEQNANAIINRMRTHEITSIETAKPKSEILILVGSSRSTFNPAWDFLIRNERLKVVAITNSDEAQSRNNNYAYYVPQTSEIQTNKSSNEPDHGKFIKVTRTKNTTKMAKAIIAGVFILLSAVVKSIVGPIVVENRHFTQTVSVNHTQIEYISNVSVPTDTPPPFVPSETHLPTVLIPTATFSPTPTITQTPHPYSFVKIGLVQLPPERSETFENVKSRLESLGFSVAPLDVSEKNLFLINYDIIYLPAGWGGKTNDFLNLNPGIYESYISSGGGILIEKADSNQELDCQFLPDSYDISFKSNQARAIDYPPCEIVQLTYTFLTPITLPESLYPCPLEQMVHDRGEYSILFRAIQSKLPSLIAGEFTRTDTPTDTNAGRIIVFVNSIDTTISHQPDNDELVVRMILWLAHQEKLLQE